MLLDIKTFPNPVLKKKAEKVATITPEMAELAKNMVETMYASNGVGLAAPQVGESIRLIVMDCSEDKSEVRIFFNPEIRDGKGKVVDVEGCLSVPGVEAKVQRFSEITMFGLNEKGQEVAVPAKGLWSRCFQHELDHLEGILFIDKLSPVQRIKVKKLIKELEEKVSS